MLSDFWSFLIALWREWKALLTGGGILAVASLVAVLRGKPQPASLNWLIVGLTFIGAAFLAWRKEWIATGKGNISISVQELKEIVRGKTTVHANSSIRPYISKRIVVTGELVDVHPMLLPLIPVSLLQIRSGDIGISGYVPSWEAKHLHPFHSGSVITVSGKIREVDSFTVYLSGIVVIRVDG